MVAWLPSPRYNYFVEYTSGVSNNVHSVYLYATSELHVKEILGDYKVLTIELYEGK